MNSVINKINLYSLHKITYWLNNSGNKRTTKIKQNALMSLAVMVLSNIVSFMLVPIVIGYLDVTKYGIWLTINSTLAWVFLLDLGLSGGLRTRLAQSLALHDLDDANVLINTAYASIAGIMIIIAAAYFFISPYIDWVKLFNAPEALVKEINTLMLLVIVFFLARFLLQIVNGMFSAVQHNSVANIISFCSQLLALGLIMLLGKYLSGSLFWIGFIYSAAPCFVFLVFTLVFFSIFRQFKLNPKLIRFSALKRILHIGVFEFVDQIAFIVLLSATNLIIVQVSSPTEVVKFNVTMRVFGLFLTVYTLATNPLIPAFTEAYTLNDDVWIKKVLAQTNRLFGLCALGVFLIVPLFKPVFSFLVKGKTTMSIPIMWLVIIIVLIRLFNNVYTKFLTGCGKVRLLALTSFTGAFFYIMYIAIFAKKIHLGVEGVLIAQILVGLFSTIMVQIQSRKILAHQATGIWRK